MKKLTIDTSANAGYLYLTDATDMKASNSIPLTSNTVLDFDNAGNILGIEILSLDELEIEALRDEFEIIEI